MPRNNDLITQRNEKIYERYKEMYDINEIRHKKALERLSKEFYLGEQAIQKAVLNGKKNDVQKKQEAAL